MTAAAGKCKDEVVVTASYNIAGEEVVFVTDYVEVDTISHSAINFHTTVPIFSDDIPDSGLEITLTVETISGAAKQTGAIGSAICGGHWPLGRAVLTLPSPKDQSDSDCGAPNLCNLLAEIKESDFWVGSQRPFFKCHLIGKKVDPHVNESGFNLGQPLKSYGKGSMTTLTNTFAFVEKNKSRESTTQHGPADDFQDLLVATERTTLPTHTLSLTTSCVKLLSEATLVSASHCWELAQAVRRRAGTFVDEEEALQNNHAACKLEISTFSRNWAKGATGVKASDSDACVIRVSLQPLGCVFARELGSFEVGITKGQDVIEELATLAPCQQSIMQQTLPASASAPPTFPQAISTFYPHVEINPRSASYQLGSIKFECTWGGGTYGEGVLLLDSYISECAKSDGRGVGPINVRILDENKNKLGSVVLSSLNIKVGQASAGPASALSADKSPTGRNSRNSTDPAKGLIHLLGLASMGNTQLDSENSFKSDPSPIGDLLSPKWLEEHASLRAEDASIMNNYHSLFKSPLKAEQLALPPHRTRHPSNFKPSSAKAEPCLSPLSINTHVQSLVIETLAGGAQNKAQQISAFSYVTCGAPCDHARGFGKIFGTNPSLTGGLKKLEAGRKKLHEICQNTRLELLSAVKEWQDSHPEASHIPFRQQPVSRIRAFAIEREQMLATVSWDCAVRRSNVFAQAVNIGITSFLASVSDRNKRKLFAESWRVNGYLVTIEGMLSATGKELSMIEDAKVGFDMLRRVEVVLARAGGEAVVVSNTVSSNSGSSADDATNDGGASMDTAAATKGSVFPPTPEERSTNNDAAAREAAIKVSNSDNVESIVVTNKEAESGSTDETIVVTLYLKPSYYDNDDLLPPVLKTPNASVQFVPALFQMGVDIKQYAKNVADGMSGKKPASVEKGGGGGGVGGGGNGNNQADEEGGDVVDTDLLASLNYEAFTKLNLYAHKAQPLGYGGEGEGDGGEDISIHPLLGNLWDFVSNHSNKIEHGVLDAAGSATQVLGGGGVIYCKSGKDRTGMGVTLRQAQYLASSYNRGVSNIRKDANVMRQFGCRISLCEKNIGEARYAFNSIQAKFMPILLVPPSAVLANLWEKEGNKIET